MRNLIYKDLERKLPSSVYKEAEAQDEAVWRKSVRKRIEGRVTNTDTSSKTQE